MKPPEVDLAHADPALAGAPDAVRRADAWLRSTKAQRAIAGAVGMAGLIAPLAMGALAHDLGGATEATSALLMLGGLGCWAGYVVWLNRTFGHTTAWATTMVKRWKELQALGEVAALATPAAAGPLDAMLARVDALAGDRPGLRERMAEAGARARKLEAELRHLEGAATGDPRADAALDSARLTLRAELDRIRAAVAETYAALAEIQATAEGSSALEETVRQLSAELEVDRTAAGLRSRATRAAAAQREG